MFSRTSRLAGLLALAAAGLLAQPAAEPAPLAIAGAWQGAVQAPQGPLELGFRFARLPDGKIDFALHMPSMHLYDQKVGPYVEEKDGGFTVPFLDIAFRVVGTELRGTFGKANLPMALVRGDNYSAAPVTPAPGPSPAPLWEYPLGAVTWGSPVVHDGVVYLGARNGRFHAVRTSDGVAVWTWSGSNRIDGRAAVTADSVCFVDGKVDLVCLDRATGTQRWRTALHDEKIAGGPAPENPTFNRRTATPLVVGDTVYAGSSDGGLYALDAATGAVRWRFAAGAPVFTGVTLLDDGSLLFGSMDGSVVRLDAAGKELSRFKAGGPVVTTPVVIGGNVVVGSRDYMLYAFGFPGGDPAWKYSYGFSWVESTPNVSDGLFYLGGSDWQRVSAFDPKTGRPVWTTTVGGMTWGTPAVTARTVYAGTVAQLGALVTHRSGIIALDRRTGAIRWRFEQGTPTEQLPFAGTPGSIAVAGDRIIAAGFDGIMRAFAVE